ncbi:LptF/LptG family permease [Marinilabiliaceae bacterium ANBcel2]|nr:LptF/LptG family permease [Marinilabiliaceae bacterium ANBcel2]
MKKLDLFILRSYIGPLAITFFISMFILVMQFLWRYVDDLVGKGLEWTVMLELLFYASLQVVPMALPLAILLASLMTFGNLGENYELTALKAAGISLQKIMRPITVLTLLISILAYAFSNNVLPVANLKLVSLLHGIRETNLEMDIKEGVFYQGVDDFSIKVEKKSRDGNMLYDVMIYDHRGRHNQNTNVTLADSGQLQMSEDRRNLVLTLYDGVRYDERINPNEQQRQRRSDNRMFRTDNFKQQTAIMQVEGFDFSRTDEELFSQSDRMKNISQLINDIDSINRERDVFIQSLEERAALFHFNRLRQSRNERVSIIDSAKISSTDSLFNIVSASNKHIAIQNATRTMRDQKQTIDDQMRFIEREDERLRRHTMELHRKFTLSIACLIFFFIGAPLGAIIRKGGLGMPVVISVLFFVVYYIVDTMGAKFAREGVWLVVQGMWLSTLVLLPIGAFLTYKSATDSNLLNADVYYSFLNTVKQNIITRIKRVKG